MEMTSVRKSEKQDFLTDLKKPAGFFTFPQARRRLYPARNRRIRKMRVSTKNSFEFDRSHPLRK